MTGVEQLRRLEQWMTYVRWFGILFAVVSLVIQPRFPDTATQAAAWALVACFAIGSMLLWGILARVEDEDGLVKLGRAGFALDMLVIFGFVWIFSFEQPRNGWALLFLIPLEAALRYRLKGALWSAAGVAVFYIAELFHHADLHGGGFDVNSYVFTVGLATLIGGVAGVMADGWHEKSLAFEKQSSKLTELDRLKDRYLAVTSHEIRGPLTAIISGTDTLLRRGDRLTEDQRRQLLEMTAQQSHQLARLVEDLMIGNELQAGAIALHPQWVELEPTLRGALQAADSKRQAHRLEVFVQPLRCEIDPARVSQLIRNLVENAYKYTPDRTRVSVTAQEARDGILLEVSDDGPGIPVEKRSQLFEAFSRIEETAAGKEGVGLGLFVVSQLVTSMQGRIDFASSTRGTTFGIHVPCPVERMESPRLGLVHDADGTSTS